MNPAHLHLLLNHLPVLGTAFGFLLLAWGITRRSQEVKQAALGVLVLAALTSIPTFLTGEPAEEMVKGLPGVSRAAIGRHESVAELALIALLVLGAMGLLALLCFRRGKVFPAWLAPLMLAASLAVSGLMAWTANLGGKVRHTEIRPGAAPAVLHDSGNSD